MNRVVLITGGSRGIGEAMVRRFARGGDSVVFTWRSEEARAAALAAETGAEAVRLDVSEAGGAEGLVRQVLARCGRIDVLVNNAGTSLNRLVIDTTDAE